MDKCVLLHTDLFCKGHFLSRRKDMPLNPLSQTFLKLFPRRQFIPQVNKEDVKSCVYPNAPPCTFVYYFMMNHVCVTAKPCCILIIRPCKNHSSISTCISCRTTVVYGFCFFLEARLLKPQKRLHIPLTPSMTCMEIYHL